MEMLFGPYGIKLWELAQHYPSAALGVALAGLAAIDWLSIPMVPPAMPGVGGFLDAGDGDRGE
jgi:hypothetical protein